MEEQKPIQFNLRIGALAPTISEQITEYKLEFNKEEMERLEKCCDSILVLKFAGVVTDNEANKCRDRIAKKVIGHVKKKNNLKTP